MTIMLLAPTWKTWMISPQAGAMDDDKVYAAFNNAFSSHSNLTLWVQIAKTQRFLIAAPTNSLLKSPGSSNTGSNSNT